MLLPGDRVRVRPISEISATLDRDGAFERLPFMPEMLPFCGHTFGVLMRAEIACAHGLPAGERPLRRLDHSVVLEGLRCDGSFHGGCQLGCMFIWKETWLEKATEPASLERTRQQEPQPDLPVTRRSDLSTYYCQATEIARATRPGPSSLNPWQYLRLLRVRTYTVAQLAALFGQIISGKLTRMIHALRPPRLVPDHPPACAHALQPGQWVEVKTRNEILRTLDHKGTLRGLGFTDDMFAFCGRKMKVSRRADVIISEETGKLRPLRDTVFLEGSICERHRGCSRAMPLMWREAWLRPVLRKNAGDR